MQTLFVILQYLLPQHWLSRLTGYCAECRVPWFKNLLIDLFIRRYGVDMSEAQEPDPRAYASFNAFFTRALRSGVRPLAPGNTVLCPADGTISELGRIEADHLLQAKGQHYSLQRLLGDAVLARRFHDGHFATIYLAPKDYHRVHMPLRGTLQSMLYVPGSLFSVNQATADNVPELFARNERAVCLFETDAGAVAVILVGAMIVAGIETVWAGPITPPARRPHRIDYPHTEPAPELERGAEMGRFQLGSTVIVLMQKGAVEWASGLAHGGQVRMGESLGRCHPRTEDRDQAPRQSEPGAHRSADSSTASH